MVLQESRQALRLRVPDADVDVAADLGVGRGGSEKQAVFGKAQGADGCGMVLQAMTPGTARLENHALLRDTSEDPCRRAPRKVRSRLQRNARGVHFNAQTSFDRRPFDRRFLLGGNGECRLVVCDFVQLWSLRLCTNSVAELPDKQTVALSDGDQKIATDPDICVSNVDLSATIMEGLCGTCDFRRVTAQLADLQRVVRERQRPESQNSFAISRREETAAFVEAEARRAAEVPMLPPRDDLSSGHRDDHQT